MALIRVTRHFPMGLLSGELFCVHSGVSVFLSTFKQPPFLTTYLSVCCQFMLFVIFVSCKGTGCVGRVGKP